MRFIAINGSPRGKNSNTSELLGHFLAGFASGVGQEPELIHLKPEGGLEQALAGFGRADAVLIAFPLYADTVPAIVKELIEGLQPYRGRAGNPALLFLVQSGFPEGSHTRHLVPYLENVSRRLGCRYLGTIRKGGAEGIRVQPEFMTRKLYTSLRQLGERFGREGILDPALLESLAGRDRMGRIGLWVGCVMSRFMFWNPELKKNGAFQRRYVRPYDSPAT